MPLSYYGSLSSLTSSPQSEPPTENNMGSAKSPTLDPVEDYVLKKVETKQQMDLIMDVVWAANYEPYEPLIQLVFPVLGFTVEDMAKAIVESQERFWKIHCEDPSSNWFYLEEISTNRVVACAQWQNFNRNPYAAGPPNLEATWWPQGQYQEFCERILNQIYKPRVSWMTRPHLALNWLAVLPNYRRQGLASILVDHGMKLADERGVEAWMEASSMGKPLYEKFGFKWLFKIGFDTDKKDATAIWKKCQHEMTPSEVYAMWRPKQGEWKETVDGIEKEVKMPWDLGAE